MKFHTLVILPSGTDVADGEAIESAVAKQMKPFEMWQDDLRPGEWDYYCCCTREWLVANGISVLDWPTALPNSEYLVFPADTLTGSDVTSAVVTHSRSGFRARALTTLRISPGLSEQLRSVGSFVGTLRSWLIATDERPGNSFKPTTPRGAAWFQS